MRLDPPPVRIAVRDHDPGRDLAWHPAAIARDLRRQPALAIDAREQLLDVHELRLELDHEQRPAALVPREDVDRPALAVVRERDLRRECPPVRREKPGELIVELRVTGGQQPVQLTAAPARPDVDQDAEHARDPPHGVQEGGPQLATLDARHRRLRHPGPPGDFRLGQLEPDPNHPARPTEPHVVHGCQHPGGPFAVTYLGFPPRGDCSPTVGRRSSAWSHPVHATRIRPARPPQTHRTAPRRTAARSYPVTACRTARRGPQYRTPVLLTASWTTPRGTVDDLRVGVHERLRAVDHRRRSVDSTVTTCCDRVGIRTTTSCG